MSSDFTPELRPDLLDDFYAEADEYLGEIRAQIGKLESGLGKTADPAVLEAIFRSVHSLKGISAMAGLRPAEQLAHAAEDYLRPIFRTGLMLAPESLELLLRAAQQLEAIVAAHRIRQALPDPAELVRQLSATGTKPAPEPPPAESPPPAPNLADHVAALQARGLTPWRCTFQPSRELDQRGVSIAAVRSRLSTLGEIVSATPTVRPGGSIEFEFVVGFRELPSNLAAWEADGILLTLVEPAALNATDPAAEREKPRSLGEVASNVSITPSHIVRVDLSRLDELMRIAGEMVIHRSRLEERLSQLPGENKELQEVNHALARSLRHLRTAITRVRLVPVAEIFTRLPFVVRDLARETGKKVSLLVEGQHTEVDKYLVERLKEPLVHLVRNAFSHGVEPPEERTAAGKSAEATILLRAKTAGEFVSIEIRDDGRGIDATAVARRAVELGVPVPDPLDETGLLQILCTAGFSTREEADRAAGRGVGMSVVYNTVRALGGAVMLETKPGTGTKFTLRLPLTLSIAETIIVSAGEHTCAVPQGYVDEVMQVPEAEVRSVKQSEVIPYRDGLLPLVRLRSMFGSAPSDHPHFAVLVVSSERGSTGLAVDRVHTQREIVMRPMSDPLLQVPGIAGATELGDGRPVLILDPIALTQRVVRPRAAAAAR